VRAQIKFLPDGRRLHLQDGPIDLIIEAFGSSELVKAAYEAAIRRFVTVLDELCSELDLLRTRVGPNTPKPQHRVARSMAAAVAPYSARTFITPMAAVAGAVAEEILEAMTSVAQLSKAYVNNGGDIALYLSPGEQFVVGMIARPDCPSLFGTATLCSSDAIGGIATSGWRGRSFSLGIADAVTVLARRPAMADAAATIIANAVNLPEHSSIHRVPARSISPDSDLGDLLVTEYVGELSVNDVELALANGAAVAECLMSESLIHSAALRLQKVTRVVSARNAVLSLRRANLPRSLCHG
jgi:ApbE superfamily uncharacterized protein (UPF0280 family)